MFSEIKWKNMHVYFSALIVGQNELENTVISDKGKNPILCFPNSNAVIV